MLWSTLTESQEALPAHALRCGNLAGHVYRQRLGEHPDVVNANRRLRSKNAPKRCRLGIGRVPCLGGRILDLDSTALAVYPSAVNKEGGVVPGNAGCSRIQFIEGVCCFETADLEAGDGTVFDAALYVDSGRRLLDGFVLTASGWGLEACRC